MLKSLCGGLFAGVGLGSIFAGVYAILLFAGKGFWFSMAGAVGSPWALVLSGCFLGCSVVAGWCARQLFIKSEASLSKRAKSKAHCDRSSQMASVCTENACNENEEPLSVEEEWQRDKQTLLTFIRKKKQELKERHDNFHSSQNTDGYKASWSDLFHSANTTIKKLYFSLSLKYHPDKHPERERQAQELNHLYTEHWKKHIDLSKEGGVPWGKDFFADLDDETVEKESRNIFDILQRANELIETLHRIKDLDREVRALEEELLEKEKAALPEILEGIREGLRKKGDRMLAEQEEREALRQQAIRKWEEEEKEWYRKDAEAAQKRMAAEAERDRQKRQTQKEQHLRRMQSYKETHERVMQAFKNDLDDDEESGASSHSEGSYEWIGGLLSGDKKIAESSSFSDSSDEDEIIAIEVSDVGVTVDLSCCEETADVDQPTQAFMQSLSNVQKPLS